MLQKRHISPLGVGCPVEVDISLICSTHRKMREEAGKGAFQSELYYRINRLTVKLPALCEPSNLQTITERMLAELNPGQ